MRPRGVFLKHRNFSSTEVALGVTKHRTPAHSRIPSCGSGSVLAVLS